MKSIEKKVEKNRVRRFNIIFVCVWVIGFMFILIMIGLDNGFENSLEVDKVYYEIQKYIDKNETEVFLNETKITNINEKDIILNLLKGKDYEENPIQYHIAGDINKMQEVQVKLKKNDQEKIIKIYQNFTCFKNSKKKEYTDEYGNYCDMSVIIKLEYNNQEKTYGIYRTDEATEVLRKYRKAEK